MNDEDSIYIDMASLSLAYKSNVCGCESSSSCDKSTKTSSSSQLQNMSASSTSSSNNSRRKRELSLDTLLEETTLLSKESNHTMPPPFPVTISDMEDNKIASTSKTTSASGTNDEEDIVDNLSARNETRRRRHLRTLCNNRERYIAVVTLSVSFMCLTLLMFIMPQHETKLLKAINLIQTLYSSIEFRLNEMNRTSLFDNNNNTNNDKNLTILRLDNNEGKYRYIHVL